MMVESKDAQTFAVEVLSMIFNNQGAGNAAGAGGRARGGEELERFQSVQLRRGKAICMSGKG